MNFSPFLFVDNDVVDSAAAFGSQAQQWASSFLNQMQGGPGAALDPQEGGNKGPPPASKRFRLPVVNVTPPDLVDPMNRECCICMDPIEVNSQAARLPCAHLFHVSCCSDWLKRSCTCPVCRYEVPTDDPEFERGRAARMKDRKPRFAPHELARLPIKQLLSYLPASKQRLVQGCSKQQVIDMVRESNSIEVVESPEPVRYRLADLEQMSIAKLKRCMNDEAGVFFDPRDVIEKRDMLRIFLASGRLEVLPPEETEDKADEEVKTEPFEDTPAVVDTPADGTNGSSSDSPSSVRVETVAPSDGGIDVPSSQDERIDDTLIMEENLDYASPERSSRHEMPATTPSRSEPPTPSSAPSEPSPMSIDSPEPAASDARHTMEDSNEQTGSADMPDEAQSPAETTGTAALEAGGPASSPPVQLEVSTSGSMSDRDQQHKRRRRLQDDADSEEDSPETSSPETSTATTAAPGTETGHINQSEKQVLDAFQGLGISQLRALARDWGVDLTGCIERSEMVQRLTSNNNSSWLGQVVDQHCLGVPEIRILATLASVDLGSTCGDADTMMDAIERESRVRPYIRSYIEALAPWVKVSVADLLALARIRQVSVTDCLEKIEILQRIFVPP